MSDIATLFARDPLKHTREDRVAIIEKLRSMRHIFNSGNAGAGNVKKLTPKETAASTLKLDIDL